MREVRDRYEIFLKVCETGNFTKAAEALNYTQSGISQMMAGLEEELGVQLFARAKKGVVLTDNGQRLIPYIREMVNQKEKLRQAAFNINNKVEGRLRIGSFSSVTAMWLPHVVHFFKENYPQVEVQIFDGNYDEIHDWIIRGQVDCGFLSSILAEDLTAPCCPGSIRSRSAAASPRRSCSSTRSSSKRPAATTTFCICWKNIRTSRRPCTASATIR